MGFRHVNRTLVTVSILALALTGALIFPLSGDWADRLLSDWCSRRFGVPVSIANASVHELRTIRFSSMSVDLPFSDDPVVSGEGTIRLWPAGPAAWLERPNRVDLSMKGVTIPRELLSGAPVIGRALDRAFEDSVRIDQLDVTWSRRDGFWNAHVARLSSPVLRLHGGFRLEGTRPTKAHWVILLPPERLNDLPRQLRASLIRREDGWGALRLVYGSGLLRAIGRRGTFFEASWQEHPAQRND